MEAKLSFYKTKAVYDILKRYPFTEEQKSIIYSAIATAKREKPNMKLIDRADEVLKMVASSRKPAPIEIDEMETKKSISKAQLAGGGRAFKTKRSRDTDRSRLFVGFFLLWSVLAVGVNYYMEHHEPSVPVFANGAERHLELYTFSEAKKLCADKGKVLPLSLNDSEHFLAIPDDYNDKGYWSAKQTVIYNIAKLYGNEKDIKGKHYVVCVDKNGKSSP